MVSKIVTITLPEEVLERIEQDRNSSLGTIKRSELIRTILVEYYKKKEDMEKLIQSG